MQQADKSCTFTEFTDLMHHLLKAAWGDDWGTFTEAFPNGLEPESVKMPVITLQVLSKLPGVVGKGNTREIKPRFRQSFPGMDDDSLLNVYSQVFDYQIMFDLWHENNTKADKLAERFEDFMITYAGYMMSQGVGQITFLQMTGDDGRFPLRDKAVCRHYRYHVRLEKHIEVPISVIKEVITKVSVTRNLANDSDLDTESIDFKSK